ncbi:MAG: hypothetical protein CM15mP86_09870 [Gammaproteobacteria bacterium]|nr:MAG: hypothetical protein CM15mP86_09870 [Gammaproteobacteria bacterium]
MQNLFEVAEATAITANERKESRGAHAEMISLKEMMKTGLNIQFTMLILKK